MTAQLESQRLYDPAARSKSEIRWEREEYAASRVDDLITRGDESELCRLLSDDDVLSDVLQAWKDGDRSDLDVGRIYDAICRRMAAEIEEAMDA